MMTSNGILLNSLISILLFVGGICIGKWIVSRRIKESNKDKHRSSDQHKNLSNEAIKDKEMEQFLLLEDVVEKEQNRIAHELHDDTVQRMVAVRLRLEQLLNYRLPEGAIEDVQQLRKELDEIISTLRFLIKGLTQPRFERHSISYHVKNLFEKLSAMHHQKVVFEIANPELEFNLPPHVNQEVFYLVHETVHNYLKSSWGFELMINMKWGPELIITIKDNGQGLQQGRGFGLGMVSMKERADRIGADLLFHSTIRGLNVQIKIKDTYS